MSWLNTFRRGVAKATATESGGLIAFRDNGGYLPGEVGLFGVVLPDSPDEAIALSTTILARDVETSVRVTFRFRAGSEARLDAIEDALINSWESRPAGMLDGIAVVMAKWSSGASLGQDGNNRLLRSANFIVTAHRNINGT